jgi:hypothetical protein
LLCLLNWAASPVRVWPHLASHCGPSDSKGFTEARLANQPTTSPVRSPRSSVTGGGEPTSSDAPRLALTGDFAGEEHPTHQVLPPLLSPYCCAKGSCTPNPSLSCLYSDLTQPSQMFDTLSTPGKNKGEGSVLYPPCKIWALNFCSYYRCKLLQVQLSL